MIAPQAWAVLIVINFKDMQSTTTILMFLLTNVAL
jgi:hypothetical protein